MTQGYVRSAAALLASLLTLPAYAQPGPTQAELSAAASNAVDWLHPNHDYEGRRFADAAEIDRSAGTSSSSTRATDRCSSDSPLAAR
jgi:hypothetical protein